MRHSGQRDLPARYAQQAGLPLREAGFSLLELLLVVTLVLIVTAMAIPSITRTLEVYRLDSSAAMIESTLADARTNAIKLNRPAWLFINAAAGQVQVETIDPAAPPAILAIGGPGLVPRTLSLVAPTPQLIVFDSLGRPSVLATPRGVPPVPPYIVRLQVARSGQQKDITISPAGQVRVN